MQKRGDMLLPSVALAIAGCASAGKLEIRPVGQQSAAEGQPASVRIALAQGHLALGTVGLALEEFRRAAREEPTSIVALAGLAQCYELMGRFDLTRRYYEEALAIAPGEPAVSLALAASLERNGRPEQASALRAEVAERASKSAEPALTSEGSVAELPGRVARAEPVAALTVVLPKPRPVEARGARLERLSAGEVALVTSDRSPWIARKVASTPRSVTVQFEKRKPMVVLNAARVAGIAARTRDYLARRGFVGAKIGDAPAARRQTLILYPETAREQAERIAAQFPFPARLVPGNGPLTLLVGRDAASRVAPRAG